MIKDDNMPISKSCGANVPYKTTGELVSKKVTDEASIKRSVCHLLAELSNLKYTGVLKDYNIEFSIPECMLCEDFTSCKGLKMGSCLKIKSCYICKNANTDKCFLTMRGNEYLACECDNFEFKDFI